MTTKQIDEAAWIKFPYTWPNNRGSGMLKTKTGQRYITYGFPPPPPPKRKKVNGKMITESRDKLKGGDRIGWTEIEITPDMVGKKIAVFTNIEIKGPGDTIKKGQKDFHNLVLNHHGISQIWFENKIIKEII